MSCTEIISRVADTTRLAYIAAVAVTSSTLACAELTPIAATPTALSDSTASSTTFLVLNRSSYSKWNSLQGNPEVALDPATIAEADDYASNSRTYGITSGVTGVLALGLGITAAVTW